MVNDHREWRDGLAIGPALFEIVENEMAKAKKLDKVYIDSDGNEGRHAKAGAERLEIRFVGGHILECRLSELNADTQLAAAWHGVSQKVGDACSGKTGDDAVEACEGMWENIVGGVWVAAKEGGPRVTLLAEAIVRAKADEGVERTIEAVQEALKADEGLRKGALEVPAIAAHYAAIQAERAAKRAKEAKAAAKTAGADGATGLAQF